MSFGYRFGASRGVLRGIWGVPREVENSEKPLENVSFSIDGGYLADVEASCRQLRLASAILGHLGVIWGPFWNVRGGLREVENSEKP